MGRKPLYTAELPILNLTAFAYPYEWKVRLAFCAYCEHVWTTKTIPPYCPVCKHPFRGGVKECEEGIELVEKK